MTRKKDTAGRIRGVREQESDSMSNAILTGEHPPVLSIFDVDTPRVHAADPDTSHQAADKSARNLSEVKATVLMLLNQFGPMTASEANRYYAGLWEGQGWPRVRYEVPRKRLSDLKKAGLVLDSGERRLNEYGSLEVVVALAGVAK